MSMFRVATEGKALCGIYCDKGMEKAAEQLKIYLQKITGAEFACLTEKTGARFEIVFDESVKYFKWDIAGEALIISGVRMLLVSVTFGSPATLLYSAAGGFLSFLVMWLLRKTEKFSVVGVSAAGGICHNLGQLAVAAILTGAPRLWWYLAALLPSGLITGVIVGVLCRLILPKLEKMPRKP